MVTLLRMVSDEAACLTCGASADAWLCPSDDEDVEMVEPEEVVAMSSKAAKAKAKAAPAPAEEKEQEAGSSTATAGAKGAKKRVRKQRVVIRKERSKDAKGYTGMSSPRGSCGLITT